MFTYGPSVGGGVELLSSEPLAVPLVKKSRFNRSYPDPLPDKVAACPSFIVDRNLHFHEKKHDLDLPSVAFDAELRKFGGNDPKVVPRSGYVEDFYVLDYLANDVNRMRRHFRVSSNDFMNGRCVVNKDIKSFSQLTGCRLHGIPSDGVGRTLPDGSFFDCYDIVMKHGHYYGYKCGEFVELKSSQPCVD
jgi:hypothetical protein